MKKLRIEFWYRIFGLGCNLSDLGDWMSEVALGKLENTTKNDPKLLVYQKRWRKVP